MTTETLETTTATHACACVHCIERSAAIDADRQHTATKADIYSLEALIAHAQTSTTRWVLATVLGFGAIQTALTVRRPSCC